MAIQRTLSIIKPDATRRNITGKINAKIEEAGFRIVAQKRLHMTLKEAQGFYAVHFGKPFYERLCNSISSAPVVVQVLEGEDVIGRYRELMGTTDPTKAAEGTLRKLFAESMQENSVHGSDSPESATFEISYFFNQIEIVG